MKSLFPEIEIYKDNEDVTKANVSRDLIRDLAELFKKYGFNIRLTIQTNHEKDNDAQS